MNVWQARGHTRRLLLKLTKKQEQLLREFAETEDHKVNPESHGFWSKIKDALS